MVKYNVMKKLPLISSLLDVKDVCSAEFFKYI
jgi:hypothetical protein